MNRYAPPASAVDENAHRRTLRESDYFKAWFLYTLCALLAGVILGGVLGGIAGAILGASGSSMESIRVVATVAGALGGLVASYLLFRFFVRVFIVRKLAAIGTGPDA